MAISIRQRYSLAVCHLQAAEQFQQHAHRIEGQYGDEATNETTLYEHRSYVIGTVMTAVGFLEAVASEVIADAADEHSRHLPGLTDTQCTTLRHFSRLNGTRGMGPLDKIDMTLVLCGLPPYERGLQPYQDAALAVSVRNALVHYVPEWVSIEGDPHKFEKQLSGKFSPSPFKTTAPYWPMRCLSAGCATWVLRSCIALAGDFLTRLGLTPWYDVRTNDPYARKISRSDPNTPPPGA